MDFVGETNFGMWSWDVIFVPFSEKVTCMKFIFSFRIFALRIYLRISNLREEFLAWHTLGLHGEIPLVGFAHQNISKMDTLFIWIQAWAQAETIMDKGMQKKITVNPLIQVDL